MIKLLSIGTTSEIGGADVILQRTLTTLDRSRFEPHVLLPKPGPLDKIYSENNVKIHYLPMKKLSKRLGALHIAGLVADFFPMSLRVRKLCQAEKIDIIHSNTLHCPYGWLPAKLLKLPHVWHIREIVSKTSWIGRLEASLVRRTANRIICMSQAIEKATFNVSPPQSTVIYDGVDTSIFKPEGPTLHQELKIAEDRFVIGVASRLDPWKGILEFIEALPKIFEAIPQTHVVIAGGEIEGHADYAETIRKKCETPDLKDRISLTGWTYSGDQMANLYRTFDVFVNSSTSPEPFGMSIVEALACGVPAVSGQHGGPAEIITSNCGLLLEVLDPPSLAKNIVSLATNKLPTKKCSLRVHEHFELTNNLKIFENELESLVKANLAPSIGHSL